MKILLLTNRIPFPPDSGYPIVIYNTIEGLVGQGAEVSVFSLNPQSHFVDVRHLRDPLLERIKFQSSYIDNSLSTWRALSNLFTRRSSQVMRFFKSNSVAKLRNFLRHNDFDIIQLEGLFMMAYLNIIRQNSKAKIVYRAHAIEHQVNSANIPGTFFTNFYRRILSKRMYRFELENLNKPDAVITISESDKSKMQSLGCKVRLENFPVVLNTKLYVTDSSRTEYPSLFHIGSMDFLPTVEGLEWFLDTVWQDLRTLNSGLKLHLAGRDMPDQFYSLEDNHLIIHDGLVDAKEFINSKAIMIVPLRSGSGMRVKIIEGMAMKKCIISTSLGAEGINYEHGKNILIADTPHEFYKYILQCSTDRKFCEEIGENARRLVEKDHNLLSATARIMNFYSELAKG